MKTELGALNCLYPLPTTLVGAHVKGKPNFITIAHVGIMDLGSLSLGMNKVHYTNDGIRENRAFSVNIPSRALIKETDYCGIVSGKKRDKSVLFDVFYGKLENAPLIRECPINLVCRLIQTVDFPKHDIFIGEIVQTFCDEECLSEGVVDFSKVDPILFVMNDKSYRALGDPCGKAWHDGKGLLSDD
jgi:flavin reductase (DIM6/NTAB) family NADH-FMN oxidoreductase RutF